MNIVRWLRVQWDRGLAVAAALAGVIALVVSWVGISDQVFAARQLPYLLSGGIGGLFLLGVGATLWLSADLRDEWHKLDRIERRMEAGGSVTAPAARTAEAGPTPATRTAEAGPTPATRTAEAGPTPATRTAEAGPGPAAQAPAPDAVSVPSAARS